MLMVGIDFLSIELQLVKALCFCNFHQTTVSPVLQHLYYSSRKQHADKLIEYLKFKCFNFFIKFENFKVVDSLIRYFF